ncbi:unnamed protein product [Ostreobium quekettii]|uniref:Uncharacterized protein n=1 Tax=Ostreobium quekettii TaxID=121088 RepID=A0A8S1JD59_9CHLO|nr:unnamed protein product [Ostreobium quekettii]
MYRSMEVLLEESEKAVADPNRDFSTRSLSSRHRAIDPITLSIVGGAATFITALVAWQIKGALKRRKVQNGQRLMEGGLVFTSADFIDEDMSLMFRDWHGDLNPVWSDAAEPRPMALGKVPPGKFPQVQTPPEGSPAVSHQHGSQHFDEHTADHVPQSVFSQAPQVQPGSVEPVWQQTQPAMKLDGGQALAEPSDANLEPQLARNLPLPGRGQIAKQPRLSKYQLWP